MVEARGSATFYKVTLRNSPNWHIRVEGNDTSTTVLWGVKVQAPWNAPNTDGIDVYSGSSSTIAYSSFAGGDDNIALDSDYYSLNNVLIDHIHTYGRNGISLGSHTSQGMSAITVQDVTMNADPQSFTVDASQKVTSINGQTAAMLNAQNANITTIDQAVMTAHIPVPGLNIKYNDPMGPISSLLWRGVCMRGVVSPITINPYLGAPSSGLTSPAWMTGLTYQNIHVMPSALPSSAVPQTAFGLTNALNAPTMGLVFDNVVVDSASGVTSNIEDIYAQQANIQLKDTVFPEVFGKLNQPTNTQTRTTVYGTYLVLQDVTETGTASATPTGAYSCPAGAFVDTVGELYAATPSGATGNKLIANTGTVSSTAATTLTAVITPSRAEKTYFAIPSIWAANLVAVGAPHLSGSVLFCDGSTAAGTASLGANGNGTTATLALTGLKSGSQHTYTAQYSPTGAALSCQASPAAGATVVGPVVLNVQ